MANAAPVVDNEVECIAAATAALAAAGPPLARARDGLEAAMQANGLDAPFEQMHARHSLALAEAEHERARRDLARARETLCQRETAALEREDAADVAEMAGLLVHLAAIERRRVRRLAEFERHSGSQYAGEAGGWPELVDESSGDATRLDRWLVWARERRCLR